MFQMVRLGKALLALGLAACLGAAGPARQDPEQAWRLLIGQDPAGAVAAATAAGGVLGDWIGVEAAGLDPSLIFAARDHRVAAAAAAFKEADFAEAASVLEELVAAQDAWAPADLLHLRLRLGQALIEVGRLAEADSLLGVAAEEAAGLDLPLSRCFGLYQRGRVELRLREVETARGNLDTALELALQEDLPRWAGDACIALSIVDRLTMDLEGALAWREKALEHFRVAEYPAGQARAQQYIGVIHIMQGDLTRALTCFQDGLRAAEASRDEAIRGAVLGEMAGANYLLGDFQAALLQYREAIRLVDSPRQRGFYLTNIGSIHEFQGDFDQAREVLLEALEPLRESGDRRSEAEAMVSLGETLCESGRFSEGIGYLDQALVLAREYQAPYTEAWALKCKGHGLLDQGDLAGAAAALAEATAVARGVDYFEILEWSLLGQAMVARRSGDLEQALTHLQEALEEVGEIRRRSGGASAVAGGVTSQTYGIYAETIDVMYELHGRDPDRGLDAAAFAVAQDAKARVFLNLLAEAEFDLNVSAVPGYRQQEQEILARIIGLEREIAAGRAAAAPPDTLGSLQARLAAAEGELDLLEARLRREDPRYASVLHPEPLTLAGLAGTVLRPGELFLDYALGDSASYLWAVSPTGSRFVRLPARDEVARQAEALLPLLADYNLTGGDPAWFAPQARALAVTLLGPVQDLIDRAERLVISPDGALHYLPFEILLTDDRGGTSCRDLPFLIRSKVVSVTPSASVLARVRSRKPAPERGSWLLVGDPVLVKGSEADMFAHAAGAADLPPLPFASAEMAALAGLAPSGGATILRRTDATVRNLRSAGGREAYAQVHFATHGLLNESRPRYSGLVLSPDPEDGSTGFLSVSDVFGLGLDCDQVVLAACASGLGRHVGGEGLVGLTRSFMFAGARSVVASLWHVSGEATALVMEDYYRRLAGAERDRALALALVKRAMIEGRAGRLTGDLDTAHPAFWAAFVLSGEGGG
ncbi:MAG: CHAT domain-containing protein [bacterium]